MTPAIGIAGIGLLGPGLDGWAAAQPVLAGLAPFNPAPVTPPVPGLLPATERRRTGPSVRLALAVAAEAVQASGLPPEELDTVFASSNGEAQVIVSILEALHAPDGAISPTQFHNSVHNAAAGYWGIAVGSARPSVSLGGHDFVFATGLMQAAAQVVTQRAPVLFVAHDVPLPPPLRALRPGDGSFAAAFVLVPGDAGHGTLRIGHAAEGPAADPPLRPAFDAIRASNPAARALPLLTALAARQPATLRLMLPEAAALDILIAP
ncbi:beta-ketoacyl synthase chain length factor [Roseomonas sp. CAU 1739]|uniref:beta-ketoacyl synthase chain length factor n=1 Tax=Roseomonas sp. CAU 1739 TaxID=3140364 RepID=UPI00325A4D17